MKTSDKHPLVNIIINSFLSENKLKRCVDSINKSDYSNFKIYVVSYGVDNLFLTDLKNSNKIHDFCVLKQDKGTSYQRNMGLKMVDCDADFIILIDDDVLPEKKCISVLIKTMINNPFISIAQPLLLHDGLIDSAGPLIDYLGYTYILYRGYNYTSLKSNKIYPVSYAASLVVLNLKHVFTKNLYYDLLYFNYEDVEMSLRKWKNKNQIYMIPEAKALHKRGKTNNMKILDKNLVYYNVRNKLITMCTLYDKDMFIYIFLFAMVEVMKSFIVLFINHEHFIYTLKAYVWVLKNYSIICERRKKINSYDSIKYDIKNILIKPNFLYLYKSFKQHYD